MLLHMPVSFVFCAVFKEKVLVCFFLDIDFVKVVY
jgi:hypothetical protein